jgi:hypothetical protein
MKNDASKAMQLKRLFLRFHPPVGQGPVSLRVARAVGAANFLHSDQPPDAIKAKS